MQNSLQLRGQWHPAGKSTRLEACLMLEQRHYRLEVNQAIVASGDIAELRVDDTLSRQHRVLIFPDESLFSTASIKLFDQAFSPDSLVSRVVRKLEANILLVLLSIVITFATVVAGFKWGLPWASHTIANALPAKTNEIIGANALEFLDEYFFAETQLDNEQQANIRQRFEQQLLPLLGAQSNINFSLQFRALNMDEIPVANAMALPTGELILTDRFVQLAENDQQIDVVLLHEIGHVVHRHSLERLVSSALITLSIALVTGGAESGSALADLGVGLGIGLVNSSYSRKQESEADLFAFEHALKANIDPMLLGEILHIMEQDFERQRSESDEQEQDSSSVTRSITQYFSSHPATPARAAVAKKFSDCYQARIKFSDCQLDAHH